MKPQILAHHSRRFTETNPLSLRARLARSPLPCFPVAIAPTIAIVALGALPNDPDFAGAAAGAFDPFHAFIGGTAILLATFFALDGLGRLPEAPAQEHASLYRAPPRPLRLTREEAPACGVLPLLFAWATFAWPLPITEAPRLAHYAASLAFAVGLAVLLAIARNESGCEEAAARSGGFVAALVMAEWLILPVPAFGLYAAVIACWGAALMDVAEELGARQKHGAMAIAGAPADVEQAAAWIAALDRAGIPAVARRVHQRALLPIFGGLGKIPILVPAGMVEEARAILDGVPCSTRTID